MKKLVSIVMAIALGVSLAGCGGRASAESGVEDAIQAFQNADAEANEQYWGTQNSADQIEVMRKMRITSKDWSK